MEGKRKTDQFAFGPMAFMWGVFISLVLWGFVAMFVIGVYHGHVQEKIRVAENAERQANAMRILAEEERDKAVEQNEIVYNLCRRAMASTFQTEADQEFKIISLSEFGNKEGVIQEVLVIQYEEPTPDVAKENLDEANLRQLEYESQQRFKQEQEIKGE